MSDGNLKSGKAISSEQRYAMMLNSPVSSVIIKMAIPSMISMVIMSLYNMADTFFVSSLGVEATGAVGINISLMNIIMLAGSFFATGANSFIARLLGAKRDEEASNVLSFAFFAAFAVGLVVMALGLVFMEPLVKLLGAKDPLVIAYSADYAGYILYSAPFMASVFVMNQCLRAEGSSTYSMIGMVSGSVINVGLDPLFIFVFNWGVAGAAAATAISKFISFCILIAPYVRRRTVLRISLKNCLPRGGTVSEIFKMGLPSLLRTGLMTVANVLTNNMASAFSAAALAGMSVVNRVMQFAGSAIMGFGQGYQPVAGYCWGAQDYARVKKCSRFASGAAIVSMAVIGAALFAFARQIVGVFTDSPEALYVGVLSMRAQCVVLPLHAWAMIVNSTHSALGKPVGASIIGISRQGICFIPVLLVLVPTLGLTGLCITQAIADFLAFFVALPFYAGVCRDLKRRQAAM